MIERPVFKEALTLNGQDVASLYLQVLELGGKSGYMKYRTVPVFPQVGDKINKAIERIATGQQDGREADEAGAGGGDRSTSRRRASSSELRTAVAQLEHGSDAARAVDAAAPRRAVSLADAAPRFYWYCCGRRSRC